MSGGIDSTIAAYMLKNAGYDVIGVNLIFTDSNLATYEPVNVGANACGAREPAINIKKRLKNISEKLNIEIITRDYREEFKNKIIASFVKDYECGITPNPCALCNATMKFAKMLDVMKEVNASMIATGHYANVVKLVRDAESDLTVENVVTIDSLKNHNDKKIDVRYAIKKSKNLKKDQSYMLYRLTQEQLSHIIFPLGDMDKNDVRRIGQSLNLPNANEKDSQDICFIQNAFDCDDGTKENSINDIVQNSNATSNQKINYVEFIKKFEFGSDYKEKISTGKLQKSVLDNASYLKKGEFVDKDGKVLGYHDGIVNYTIGQRRGINIAFGERKFVVRIDALNNKVVLGSNDDLQGRYFKLYDIVFSGLSGLVETSYIAKLRYRHDGTKCLIKWNEDGSASCELAEPVRAITPGQAAVFYDDNGNVMFGGRIELSI